MSDHVLSEVIKTSPTTAFERKESRVILKSPTLRVLSIALPEGEELAEHSAPGEITVHCLTGEVRFFAEGLSRDLRTGELIHLQAKVSHSLKAIANASILVTIAIPSEQ